MTYRVSGTSAHALDEIAPVVDQVIGLQFGGWAALDTVGETKTPSK